MMILALDSTAKIATVAVSEDGHVLASCHVDAGLTQSELLLPMAEHLLSSLHKDMSDVGLFACTVGPGSFTGVRIGVATVKGLAFGSEALCVGASTLEVLAENLRGLNGIFIAAMDARRSQVYRAVFRGKDGKIERLTDDEAVSLDALAEECKSFAGEAIYLVGDGYDVATRALLASGLTLQPTPRLLRDQNAASLCAVAYRCFREGRTVCARELTPFYLRLPQAERERLEKEAVKN